MMMFSQISLSCTGLWLCLCREREREGGEWEEREREDGECEISLDEPFEAEDGVGVNNNDKTHLIHGHRSAGLEDKMAPLQC